MTGYNDAINYNATVSYNGQESPTPPVPPAPITVAGSFGGGGGLTPAFRPWRGEKNIFAEVIDLENFEESDLPQIALVLLLCEMD